MDWAVTVAVAAAAVLVFQAEVAKPYRIPTSSMEPTLHCAKPADGCKSSLADRVIANRLVYRFHEPEREDIIVFDTPSKFEAACNTRGTFVKRIVGLPGEEIAMRSGYLFVNGVRLDEQRYVRAAYRGNESGDCGRVPDDGYFVLGDNRRTSCDSRRWGAVPRKNIIGRVDLVYWPPNRVRKP
jgi:signal peptidase I